MASVISLVLLAVFWGLMRQSTQATSRMNEVMKLMDGAAIQTRLDEDIRTSIQVVEPELLVMSQKLVFYNRKYEKITYEFKPGPKNKQINLERTCEETDITQIVARRLNKGMFYRTGPNLIEYELEFLPVKRPGAREDKGEIKISVSSKVFLGNGIY